MKHGSRHGQIIGFVAAVSAVLLVAGCGGGGESGTAEAQTAAVTTSSSTAVTTTTSAIATTTTTTSTAAAQASVLTDSWTDREGYSYEFALTKPSAPQVTIDVANSRPGEINLKAKYTYTGSLKNTTQGRNAPFPNEYRASTVWKSDAPVCQADYPQSAWSTSHGNPELSEAFCSGSEGGAEFQPADVSSELYPKLPIDGALKIQATYTANMTFADTVDVDALKQSFNDPFAHVLARSDLTKPVPMTSCLLKSGGIYVSAATAETGCFVE
ncbi:hypothetical protein [Rhodococcus erythropolis]|uniref:hypothetical protein n=1 Tax=Rhodococcus erythropolis TaxID=1833 RepID=UPI003013C076